MSDSVLEVKNLNKSFGKAKILHDIDLTVCRGEVCGLIGQNGAGKTTLLRMISGLMKPTHGKVTINTSKAFTGYMPQSCRFDDSSSVASTLRFFDSLKRADVGDSLALCERLELDLRKKVKHLSPGQQKKLQIVIAMIGDPDFYILDEPTAGLDPKATFEMMEIIRSIQGSGKSILVSSHILGDLDEICTNVVVIEEGKLVYSHKVEDSYIVKASPVPWDVLEALKKRYSLQTNEDNTILYVKAGKEIVSELVKELAAHSIGIFEMSDSA